MRCSAAHRCAIHTIAVLLGAAAVSAGAPAAALGAFAVTSVTLPSHVDSSAAPVGGVIFGLTATVTVNPGQTWQTFHYELRQGTDIVKSGCFPTPSHGGGPSTLPTSNPSSSTQPARGIVLPRGPGSYDATFWVNTKADCTPGGTNSERITKTDFIRLTGGFPNPSLQAGCGLHVMLVLDRSGSINSTAAAQVRGATRSFLEALNGTGSQVGIIDFADTAALRVNYTSVTDVTMHAFDDYLAHYTTGGTTNWQAAFDQVAAANGRGPVADLVVFITDGDPNTYNTGTTTRYLTNAEGDVRPLGLAQAEAGYVQGSAGDDASHVFALGVGTAVNNEDSRSRLVAITGPNEYTGQDDDFGTSDYAVVGRFGDLEPTLRQIAVALCAPSLTVTKVVDNLGTGNYQPQEGWAFTTALSVSPGTFDWRIPTVTDDTGPQTAATDSHGVTHFQWGTSSDETRSSITLTEQAPPAGYEFVKSVCSTHGSTGVTDETTSLAPDPIAPAEIGTDEFRVCTVYNRLITEAPPIPPTPPTPPTPPGPPPPTPPVPAPPSGCGFDDTSPACVQAAVVAAESIATQPTAKLRVRKRLPATAHRGERVPVLLTVTNVSDVPAEGVLLSDTPPAAATLHLAGANARRNRDGSGRWLLGTLQPGRSRTIHTTMTIQRSASGRLRNIAVANAANAAATSAQALVRIRARHRRPPAVTG